MEVPPPRNKRTFLQTPPYHLQGCFPPPTTTKNKTAYVHFYRVSQRRPTDELDTLSDSSSLPNSARLIIPHAPTRRQLKKKKIVYCVWVILSSQWFYDMKKKKERKKKKKETFTGGGRIRTRKLWISNLSPYDWATETNYNNICYKICIYIQYGVSDIRPSTCAIPQFQFWLKKPYQMHL